MFCVRTTPEKFESSTIADDFGFVVEDDWTAKSRDDYRDLSFRKVLFSKFFLSTLKRKARVFKFLRFEEHFIKALFS